MSDESIAARIERLVSEEHELRNREGTDSTEALEEDAGRLRAIEVELDVSWDLLRQRRARPGPRGPHRPAEGPAANPVLPQSQWGQATSRPPQPRRATAPSPTRHARP